jgi:ATP-dependent Lhr-like helicase
LYPVLKALEEAGRIRRGYFAATLGAAQFARPSADDRLRKARNETSRGAALVLAATDPANPFGSVLPWPEGASRAQRAAGALVVLWDGRLLGFVGRGEKSLETFLLPLDSEHEEARAALAAAIAGLVDGAGRRALVLGEIDGAKARQSPFGSALERAGFTPVGDGYVLRRSLAETRARERERR